LELYKNPPSHCLLLHKATYILLLACCHGSHHALGKAVLVVGLMVRRKMLGYPMTFCRVFIQEVFYPRTMHQMPCFIHPWDRQNQKKNIAD